MHLDIEQKATGPVRLIPVAIYTRVSTMHQIGGRFTSCESQEVVCREFIHKNAHLGWTEVASHSDPAYSGGSLKRPGMEALKAQIARGEVKVVVIFMLERVLRSTDEWSAFRRFLEEHECRLESPTGDISESEPEGRLKNNIVMSVAEYARLSTAKKVRIKMQEQAKRGIWNGGMVSYGYTYDRNTQTLLPHPEEAPLVRRVFEEAAKLRTLEQIAGALNADGFRTKARVVHRRDGSEQPIGAKRFRSDGLRFIIKNPIYRGVMRFDGQEYSARHEALVTPELWEKANAAIQKMLRPAQVIRLEQDRHFHLLKGIAHCGCCGRAMLPHSCGTKDSAGKPYRYYSCSHLVKERQDSRCPVRRVSAGSLEQAVVQFLGELGRHPAIVEEAVQTSQARRQDRRRELKPQIEEIDRQLAENSRKIQNCIEAISAGGVRIAEELGVQIAGLKDRKQELLVQRERLAQEVAACEGQAFDHARVCRSVERMSGILRGLTPAEQRELVALFIDRIDIRPSKAARTGSMDAGHRRYFELRIRVSVPRLVESMEDKVVLDVGKSRAALRGMTMSVEVALGHQGRPNQVAVLAPFSCGGEAERPSAGVPEAAPEVQHPIVRAMEWQRLRAKKPSQSLRAFARAQEVFPAAVVQHLKLLKLAPEIREFLHSLHDAKAAYHFSIRRLAVISSLGRTEQLKAFRALQDSYRPATPTGRAIEASLLGLGVAIGGSKAGV